MKNLFISAALLSGLLMVGTPGFAQEHDRDGVLQKIRININDNPTVRSEFSGERDRYSLTQTNRDLDVLQGQFANACQDCQGALDDLTDTLQRAVDDNRITGRDHQIMQEDLNLLRGTTYSDTGFAK